jgi:hypothetical protein
MQEQYSATRARIVAAIDSQHNDIFDRYEDDAFVNFCIDVTSESIADVELAESKTFDDATLVQLLDVSTVAIAKAHRRLYNEPIEL